MDRLLEVRRRALPVAGMGRRVARVRTGGRRVPPEIAAREAIGTEARRVRRVIVARARREAIGTIAGTGETEETEEIVRPVRR